MTYRGYEIKKDDTTGNGKTYYEAHDARGMWGFAADLDTLKIMIDRKIAKEEKK